jgi:hypothetical protein
MEFKRAFLEHPQEDKTSLKFDNFFMYYLNKRFFVMMTIVSDCC